MKNNTVRTNKKNYKKDSKFHCSEKSPDSEMVKISPDRAISDSKTCGAQTSKFFESKKGIFCTHTQKVICAQFRIFLCTIFKNLFCNVMRIYLKRVQMRTHPQTQKHKTKSLAGQKTPNSQQQPTILSLTIKKLLKKIFKITCTLPPP